MSITILNYLDQNLVDQVNAQALLRQQTEEATRAASESTQSSDFASALNDASTSYDTASSATTVCSAELDAIFQEAANTYGVSANLLKSIAHAESNFNANAVSSAGAIGIMQLMPSTAASLGVSDSYNPRENIMGGAKLISQLLDKYSGDTSLALAAYNAGSANVDKYGGIPPFTETQNYVKKVLSYLGGSFEVSSDTVAAAETSGSDTREQLTQALLALRNANPDTFNLLASLLNAASTNAASTSDTVTTSTSTSTSNTVSDSTSATATASATVTDSTTATVTDSTTSAASDTAAPISEAAATDSAAPVSETADTVESTDAAKSSDVVENTDVTESAVIAENTDAAENIDITESTDSM
jgi:hypothetical protein